MGTLGVACAVRTSALPAVMFRAHGARYGIRVQVPECTNLLWFDLVNDPEAAQEGVLWGPFTMSTTLERITFACAAKRNVECASHACAFVAHSHAVGRVWAQHGCAHRKRERGSRTPKQEYRTPEGNVL